MVFYWVDFYGSEAFDYMCELGFDLREPVFAFDWYDKLSQVMKDVIYKEHKNADIEEYLLGSLRILMSYHKGQNAKTDNKETNQRERNIIRASNYIFRAGGLTSAEATARYMNLSPKYLSRLFVEYKGCSLQKYIIELRLSLAAKKLKESNLLAKEIAISAGYTNYAQFSKIFKKYYNLSPLEYRESEKTKGESEI